jgi:hypothetical protein
LRNGAHSAPVTRQRGLLPGALVRRVIDHDAAVLAAPRHHAPVPRHTEPKDGALVGRPDGFGDGVVAAAPDKNVSVRVPGE